MTDNISELQGDKFFYGNLGDYLGGELTPSSIGQFNGMIEGKQKEIDQFQENRGKFHSALGDIGASEAVKHKLRTMAQDDQIRETSEASDILELGRAEMWSHLLRRTVLGVMAAGIVGFAAFVVWPKNTPKFDIIENLGYEAVALEEDPSGRVSLPSSDGDEIRQFIGHVTGLSYVPQLLRPIAGWNYEGVSIIEYDDLKIIGINYVSPDRKNEHLYHFMTPGVMADLPFKGEEADYRGLKYRVYGSEKINLVVWQHTPTMVSVLAGHRSAPELAEMARTGDPE